MTTYRQYMLNDQGRIEVGEWIEAVDLRDAERQAREICRARFSRCEIWQGAERLADFSCIEPEEGE